MCWRWLDNNRELKDSVNFIQASVQQEREGKALIATMRFLGRLVGLVSFNEIDLSKSTATLGYGICHDAGGNGFVTRSVEALIDFGFQNLSLQKIIIRCATENQKSNAIPKRLGFKLNGIIKDGERLYGHFVDHFVYSITKADWK